jgi:membrane protease subunit HflK
MDKSMEGQLKSAGRMALNLFLVIAVLLAVLYLCSGIYSIENNEVGVLQRFGEVIDAAVQPGIHYAFPWPVDRVSKVPFPKVERIHIQDFSQDFMFGGGLSFSSLTGLGTYCVTGDNNLVNLECVIQYEVRDPRAYLFNLGEGVATAETAVKRFLIEMACNTVLHCLSTMAVDDVLTNWERIVTYVKAELQLRLNAVDSGVSVTFVEITGLGPPPRVSESFSDVITAKNEKKTLMEDADTYNNQEIPAARGRADRLRSEAEGYRNEVVQNARGEARRFLDQLGEYRKDKALTRYRLYMETLQAVFAAVGRLDVVDTYGKKSPVEIKMVK